MNNIIREFNTVKDKLYFHHTITDKSHLPSVYGPESHNRFELLYLKNGNVDYVIEGERYSVTAGDCIFVAPNEIHKLYIEDKSNYERIVLIFDTSVFKNLLSEHYIEFTNVLNKKSHKLRVIPKEVVDKTQIPSLLEQAISCSDTAERLSLFLVSKILLLVLELDKVFSNDYTLVSDSADPLIKEIVAFINANLDKHLTLESISNHFFISKSSLSHRFKAHMNMSVKNYLSIKKIHYASELIKNGMNATECAKMLGYEHYTTFFSSYKKILGELPSDKKK